MKGKRIVKMFESIPNYDTYGHYNSILEKVFKSNSLKNFIETLKRQKEIKEISLLDTVNMSIDIYSLKDDLLFNIEKIVLYFPKDKYIKENNGLKYEILIFWSSFFIITLLPTIKISLLLKTLPFFKYIVFILNFSSYSISLIFSYTFPLVE